MHIGKSSFIDAFGKYLIVGGGGRRGGGTREKVGVKNGQGTPAAAQATLSSSSSLPVSSFKVAVVPIDPSSHTTGGSILGK
jgi:hypothetical protein